MVELCASMMCANYAHLENEVHELDSGGIDIFHIDIMDGRFVDNFGMGYQDMKFIRSATDKQLEAHLMVKNPWNYLETLHRLNINIIYIHPESDMDPATTLEKIRKMNMIPGIAINPGTSIPYVKELFNFVDRILVLCVNPGHAGRQFIPWMNDKISLLLRLRKKYNFEICLDGACTMERIEEWTPKGVRGFVLGTSVLFGKKRSYSDILHDVRKKLESRN